MTDDTKPKGKTPSKINPLARNVKQDGPTEVKPSVDVAPPGRRKIGQFTIIQN